MAWWKHIFNIDIIAFVCISVAVIYFIIKEKLNKSKFNNSDFEFGSVNDIRNPNSYWIKGKKSKIKKKKINQHEEKCRDIFQKIFRQPFKSIRPKWLRNPKTKKRLELDGYNPYITTHIGKGLAFEYDGIQHAKYNPHFHRGGTKDFEYQVEKDKYKDKRCKELGVLLVRIPHYIIYDDLEDYIRKKLDKLNLPVLSRGLYS